MEHPGGFILNRKVFMVTSTIFYIDNGMISCEYTDSSGDVFIMSDSLSKYESDDLAKEEMLKLAKSASESSK